MKAPARITIAWLREHKACADHVKLFTRTFGDGADLTAENITTAVAAGLDLAWLAERVLSAPARAEYERVKATALAGLLWPAPARAGEVTGG